MYAERASSTDSMRLLRKAGHYPQLDWSVRPLPQTHNSEMPSQHLDARLAPLRSVGQAYASCEVRHDIAS